MPMIRNNLLLLLSSQDPKELNDRTGKDQLRKAILREIQKVLKNQVGAAGIEKVFFTSFVMQ